MIEIHLPTRVSHYNGRYSMWFVVDSGDENLPLEVWYQLYAHMMGWC